MESNDNFKTDLLQSAYRCISCGCMFAADYNIVNAKCPKCLHDAVPCYIGIDLANGKDMSAPIK